MTLRSRALCLGAATLVATLAACSSSSSDASAAPPLTPASLDGTWTGTSYNFFGSGEFAGSTFLKSFVVEIAGGQVVGAVDDGVPAPPEDFPIPIEDVEGIPGLFAVSPPGDPGQDPNFARLYLEPTGRYMVLAESDSGGRVAVFQRDVQSVPTDFPLEHITGGTGRDFVGIQLIFDQEFNASEPVATAIDLGSDGNYSGNSTFGDFFSFDEQGLNQPLVAPFAGFPFYSSVFTMGVDGLGGGSVGICEFLASPDGQAIAVQGIFDFDPIEIPSGVYLALLVAE